MNKMPTPTTMEKRFDIQFDICDNPDHTFIETIGMVKGDIGRLGCPVCSGKYNDPKLFIPSELKSFIQSEIDLVIAEERKRIVEMIREYAEPYDGAIWLNEVNAQKIINLITNK